MEVKPVGTREVEYRGSTVKIRQIYLTEETLKGIESIGRDRDFDYFYEDTLRLILEDYYRLQSLDK